MATNFGVKIGKIRLFTFIRSPGIPKWIAIYYHSDLKRLIYDDLATLCVNFVNNLPDRFSPTFHHMVAI